MVSAYSSRISTPRRKYFPAPAASDGGFGGSIPPLPCRRAQEQQDGSNWHESEKHGLRWAGGWPLGRGSFSVVWTGVLLASGWAVGG